MLDRQIYKLAIDEFAEVVHIGEQQALPREAVVSEKKWLS